MGRVCVSKCTCFLFFSYFLSTAENLSFLSRDPKGPLWGGAHRSLGQHIPRRARLSFPPRPPMKDPPQLRPPPQAGAWSCSQVSETAFCGCCPHPENLSLSDETLCGTVTPFLLGMSPRGDTVPLVGPLYFPLREHSPVSSWGVRNWF